MVNLERSYVVRHYNIAIIWFTVPVAPRVIIIESVSYWNSHTILTKLHRHLRIRSWFDLAMPNKIIAETFVAAERRSSPPPGQSSAQPITISSMKNCPTRYTVHCEEAHQTRHIKHITSAKVMSLESNETDPRKLSIWIGACGLSRDTWKAWRLVIVGYGKGKGLYPLL